MLDEKDRERIRAEEIFREEVRREIQAQAATPSSREKLWNAINSSFFLWCMSSVVLGILSFSYQAWSADRGARAVRAEMARKIDAEIASRLSFFRDQLLIGVGDKDALNALEFSGSVFFEFRDRSFRSLLWDLASLVPKTEEPEIQRALQESVQFSSVYLFADSQHDFFHTLSLTLNSRPPPETDIFAELDKKASPSPAAQKTADPHLPTAKPKAKDTSGWDALKDIYVHHETTEEDVQITFDIYTPDLPSGSVKVVSILPNSSNPTVKAFNLTRWGTPFTGLGSMSALQAKIFQELKSKR